MFPYKKINIFVICFFFLSVIIGSIYANIINIEDKKIIIEKVELFVNNINNNSLSFIKCFRNSLLINYSYIFIIWLFGMTILGILFNVSILFLKGFIIGFSISSFIVTYSYKGILLSFIYLIFGQLLNILIILSLSAYAIMFTFRLLELIFKQKQNNLKKNIKLYFIILIILIFLSFISSLSETYFLPAIIKLIIKLFIS